MYTPEPEPYFELEYKDPSSFNDLKNSHNIVIASLFTPPDSTGDPLVRLFLPSDQLEMAIRGENQIFATNDYFARGQVIGILAGNTEEDLSRSVRERGRWLYDRFDSAFIQRQRKYVFRELEQKKLSRRFEKEYGWSMRIQHDYVIIREKPEKNFVWLGRSFPYRWLTVNWIENPAAKTLDAQTVSELVRSYPDLFFEDIAFSDEYGNVEKTMLKEWTAWRVEGLWEHKKEVIGGPFVAYLFYDGATDRLFHVNFIVHYPGRKKIVLLRQMETMVHTFSVPPA